MTFSPRRVLGLGLFALAGLASAQEDSDNSSSIKQLIAATESFTELFLFRSLLALAPEDIDSTFDGKDKGVTVLAPTNDAVSTYMAANNISTLDDVQPENLVALLEYHVIDKSMKSDDFDAGGDKGLVIPTRLSDEVNNNRTAGARIQDSFGDSAIGQVIVAVKEKQSQNSSRRLRIRQSQDSLVGPIVNIKAGLDQELRMTAIDSTWGPNNENTLQIVDKVLIPPANCSTTVRSLPDDLDAFDKAISKVGLWSTLNTAFNVTCLAPTTSAFDDAGNPEDALEDAQLKTTLLLHTLHNVGYSSYLEDGMEFKSLNDFTVRVSVKDNDVYFNNAKMLKSDVLTNNGVIITVDAVVKKLKEEEDKNSSDSDSNDSGEDGNTDSNDSEDGAPSLAALGSTFAIVLMAGVALL